MIVQIYTAQSAAEALALAQAGADHVGLTPTDIGLPGQISDAVAAEAVRALRGVATSVALSVSADLDEIVRMARTVAPDVLHLCAERGVVTPDQVQELRGRLPGIRIMQAISVSGPEAIEDARSYAPVSDFLILDSHTHDVEGIGASGETHDWSISAAIVAESPVPVVLAGGLSPANVGEAIAAVRPWGVDSLTWTNRSLPGGGFEKDLDAVRAFVAGAGATVRWAQQGDS